jgi:hypothetical protein
MLEYIHISTLKFHRVIVNNSHKRYLRLRSQKAMVRSEFSYPFISNIMKNLEAQTKDQNLANKH